MNRRRILDNLRRIIYGGTVATDKVRTLPEGVATQPELLNMPASAPKHKSHERVAIAVATYNHAHFLTEALASIARQSRPADEVIVVDDGSEDQPETVVARFAGVRLIRRANGGLAAARNTALAATGCDRITFLDADDVLEPDAIAAGLACFADHPDAGFVYGAHRRVGPMLETLMPYCLQPLSARPDHDFLLGNAVGMHAAAMFDVAALRAADGFDPALPRCEDYDVHCRLSRTHEVAFHRSVVAGYRQHGSNMSVDHRGMLRWALAVLDRHRPPADDRAAMQAWRSGRARWRAHYGVEALKAGLGGSHPGQVVGAVGDLLAIPPAALVRDLVRRIARLISALAAVARS